MQYLLYNIGYTTNVAQKYCFYFTYANKRRSFRKETTSFLKIVLLLLILGVEKDAVGGKIEMKSCYFS